MNRLSRCVCIALACFGLHNASQAQVSESNCRISLEVLSRRQGERIELNVWLEVPSPIQLVWDVMTDYGSAERFIRNVRHSEAIPLGPDKLLVNQVGWLSWGILGTSIQTSYEIELHPALHQLTGKLVSGDLTSMDMTANLLASGAHRTILFYGLKVEPGSWISYFLAENALRRQARDSFEDLAQEMQRRTQTCPMTQKIDENQP